MLVHYANVGKKTQRSRDKLAKARSKIPSFSNVQSPQLERAAEEDRKVSAPHGLQAPDGMLTHRRAVHMIGH